MKIRAAVIDAPGAPLVLTDLDLAPPRADEVQVRLVATGVCHTDVAVMHRPFPVAEPIVLGHEGAGVIEAVGAAVQGLAVGDHVVMSYDACGTCPSCRAAASTYCHHFFGYNFVGRRPDGSTALSRDGRPVRHAFFGQSSFATHSVCSARNVVKVPKEAPLEILGPLGCGLLTGAGAVMNVLRPAVGGAIAVFGAGSVGIAGIMAARAIGATTIIAIDRVPARLALARELGATHTIEARDGVDTVAEIRRITGLGVECSFDTTAALPVLEQAVACLAPRGVCGFVGGAAPGVKLSVEVRDMLLGGKTLRGIVEGDADPHSFIPALMALHAQGRFPFERLITFYPFERIAEAIADAEAGRVVKPVLRMPA